MSPFLASLCAAILNASSRQMLQSSSARSPQVGDEPVMTENDGSRGGPARVAVVGTGNVGSTFAYALLLSGLAAEIVLIDANQARAEGEAMDLNHAAPFTHPTRIWAGDYNDCAGAAITVLTAGVKQKPGQSRLDCLQANARIWR